MLKFPTFYSLPIMLALAFSVWGLYFWMVVAAINAPRASTWRGRCAWRSWWVPPAACAAELLGVSVVFGACILLKARIRTVAGARQFACLIAPYIVVCAGIMWYNKARFGSLFDFGANYNLTVNDMTKRGMAVGRIAPRCSRICSKLPRLRAYSLICRLSRSTPPIWDKRLRKLRSAAFSPCSPFLWVLPFARRILQMRINQRKTRTVASVIGVLIGIGVLIAVADAEMAGILQRYFADFSIMFLMAAVLLLFIVNENIENGSKAHAVFVRVLPVAVAIGVAYTVLLCITAETGWASDAYPWAYQGLLETFQFWT